MIGAIGGSGNGWGQFKKAMEELAEKVRQAHQSDANATPKVTEPSPPPTTTPVAAIEPVASIEPASQPVTVAPVIASETAVISDAVNLSTSPSSSLAPLTYSAPRSAAPETTLRQHLSDAGYYASPAAASVPDPVAPAQQQDDAALTQAQVIAQAAYTLVAQAGEDHRLSLIQQG